MTVEHGGKSFRFLDTAGIRRRGKTNLIAEKLSVILARKTLERADVALMVIDGAMGFTSHDATIADYARQSGVSLIVVVNKWDLALKAYRQKHENDREKGRRGDSIASRLMKEYEKIIRGRLRGLDFAPVVFVSALTGTRTEMLFDLIEKAASARMRRISTGELNRWLASVDLQKGSSPASRQVKIYYVTQSGVAPPTFVLFTNQTKTLHFGYQRFLENQIRKAFDFRGTPVRFSLRLKKRQSRDERLQAEGVWKRRQTN
jgi:GTP-binding protein